MSLGKSLGQSWQKCSIAIIEGLECESFSSKGIPASVSCLVRNFRSGKILLKNLRHALPLCGHLCSALLAKPHTIAPAASMKKKLVALLAHLKPSARNLVPAKRLAYRQPELLRGNLCFVDLDCYCPSRFAASCNCEVHPSRPHQTGRRERCTQFRTMQRSGPGVSGVEHAIP